MQYKINLKEYEYPVKNGDKEEMKTCSVKETIPVIILHPQQSWKGFRFYTVSKVAEKIKNCKDDYILLNHLDYQVVKTAFDNFAGFGLYDVELVNRIYEAEKTE